MLAVWLCRFADWSARTPVVTRYTLITIVAVSVLNLVLDFSAYTVVRVACGVVGFFRTLPCYFLPVFFCSLSHTLSLRVCVCVCVGARLEPQLCPRTAVFGLQVWRFVTAPILQPQLLSLLFVVLWFGQQGAPAEQKHGSVGLLYLMALLGIMTNVVYAFGGLLLYYNPIIPTPLMMKCVGSFWPVLVALISVDCLANPEGSRRFFFFPCQIKNKIFPWIVAAFFSVLGGLAMDIIMGVVVAHLYAYGKLDRLKPSLQKLEAWENGRLASLAAQQGFIAAAVAGSDLTLPAQQGGGGGGGGSAGGAGGAGGGQGGGWVSSSGGDVFGRGRGAAGQGGNAAARPGTSSPSDSGPKQPKFPGSGNALAAASSSSWTSTAAPTEDMAARRAAAAAAAEARLGRLGTSGTSGGGSAPSSSQDGDGSLDSAAMQQLVSMGFNRDQASYALVKSGGDVAGAVSLLNG